ncbi:MAG: type I-C CRISPR-associated protein Cas8c/Csd1, partial [Actinomycetota bacterium]
MILAALDAYYRRLAEAGGDDAPPPYGFAVQKVSAAIQLDRDGNFLGLVPLGVKDAKGKDRPRPMVAPDVGTRPGKQIKPSFACDTAAFLLGHDPADPARALAKFQASAELHRHLLSGLDDPVAAAVVRHFERWDPTAAKLGKDAEAMLGGWLVFLVEGALAHDRPAV